MATVNSAALTSFINDAYDTSIIPALSEYIEIPNQSPLFDKEWRSNGFQEQAVKLMMTWVEKQNVAGLTMELIHPQGKSPLIFITVAGSNTSETILMYGHLDKQPPLTESWAPGLHPYKPVIKDDKLYGRGGADDGYAIFAAIASIKALQVQNVAQSRIILLIEACEESGSDDLPFYMDLKAAEIGVPSLVVCLDSGCGNYKQLWVTTSLRGMFSCVLTVRILQEGVHSGTSSGVVPSTFRIIRQLLDRIEDSKTGQVLIKEANCEIPADQREFAASAAVAFSDELVHRVFPFVPGARPVCDDLTELLLNRFWRPTISYTGINGMPSCDMAGNVLRPFTSLKLSVRLPPAVEPLDVVPRFIEILTKDPPYGAQVTVTPEKGGKGWAAPKLEPWLEAALNKGSKENFGMPLAGMGEGGSIPFMALLGRRFPKAQFAVLGVLGPGSNAHGPNEFLHIPYAKKLTCCVAQVLADHYAHFVGASAESAAGKC